MLRNKDAKWDEAKGFLKMASEDKEANTDDFELFLAEGANAATFINAKIIVSANRQSAVKHLPMSDNLDGSPRANSGKRLEGSPRTELSTHYKPSADAVANLMPTVSRIGFVAAVPDFEDELHNSERPLHELYSRYKRLLPSNAKSSLIRAMYHELLHSEGLRMRTVKDTPEGENPASDNGKLPLYLPKSKQHINEFFTECCTMITELNAKANGCLVAVQVCERSVAILISMARDASCQPDPVCRPL